MEVSLLVDGELAEAVAEVLARYVSGGVVIESTAVTADAYDEGQAVGPLRVCGYLPLTGDLDEKQRQIEEALWYLGRISPLPSPTFKSIPEINWVESWKEHYHPIPIGGSLIVLPAWYENPQQDRIAIRIDPGMAFGTGTHPTTQLCLELLETVYSQKKQLTQVIDIGCGSGILSIAALRMGAQWALGVDIDAQAIAAARENARLNGVEDRLELGLGSVAQIHEGRFSIQSASVLFANILAPVVIQLLDEGLGRLITPGGYAIFSGILEGQSAEVEAALNSHGMKLIDKRQVKDWVALLALRNL